MHMHVSVAAVTNASCAVGRGRIKMSVTRVQDKLTNGMKQVAWVIRKERRWEDERNS